MITYEVVRLKVNTTVCGRQTDSLRAADGYVLEWDGGPMITATANGVTNDIPMSNVAVAKRVAVKFEIGRSIEERKKPGPKPKNPDAV
jgi:hypothetical protein